MLDRFQANCRGRRFSFGNQACPQPVDDPGIDPACSDSFDAHPDS